MKVEPLGDRIVVKPDPTEEVTAGGVILPDDAQEKQHRGVVLAIGEEVETLAVDDKIIYSKYGGTDLTVDGDELLVLRTADVLARVKEES